LKLNIPLLYHSETKGISIEMKKKKSAKLDTFNYLLLLLLLLLAELSNVIQRWGEWNGKKGKTNIFIPASVHLISIIKGIEWMTLRF